VAELAEQQLETVTGSSPTALGLAMLVSIVFAMWSASSGVTHLIEAINIAYGDDTDDRPFWKRRLLAIGFVLGFVAFTITAVLTLRVLSGPLVVVALALIVAGGLAGFAALYRYAPDRDDPEWKWVTPGAVFAVVGWLVVSVGFRFYVARFSSYNETYGALGAILIVLIWLYLSAAVVIVGAEINTEVERQTAHDSTVGPSEPLGQRGAHAADDVAPSPD
ncbi:MAG: YihY/virulence factor BrkB family protein, partial [Acidimicrobiia bacterium]|nr:YihY/virulence factor BrkB family protein [Acidimicrobiia bacterium]